MYRLLLHFVTLFCITYSYAGKKTWHFVTDTDIVIELSEVSYLLAASTETFDIVCKDGSTVSNVKGISLEQREPTVMKPVNSGEPMFSQIVGNQLYISNVKVGTNAQVLSLSGVTLISQSLADGKNIIDVSKLLTGTYVLRVGETNIKFIKK